MGLFVLGLLPCTQASHVCNVLDHGAVGDNVTEDTRAVQSAISACYPGGTVLLPRGKVYLLRPVNLPSHTELRVDGDIAAWRDIKTWPNSTVASCSCSPYQTPRSQIIQAPQRASLLNSVNATNVTISGSGTIDGQGWRWWPLRLRPGDYWHNCRPSLVEFGRRAPSYGGFGVSNITVRGVTLKDSPFWTFSGRGMKGALISRVSVYTTGCGYLEAPNTDGFNVQGEDILIEHCVVRNGDDCVPVNSPSRNVTVRNISCECGIGLVPCVWPAMSVPGPAGSIRDVVFDGASFRNTANAVAIKSLPSFSGEVINVSWTNMTLDGVDQAVMINLFGQTAWSTPSRAMWSASNVTGIRIERMRGNATRAGKLNCMPSPHSTGCTDVVMKDVRLGGAGKLSYACSNAHGTQDSCAPPPCNFEPKMEL